MDIFEKEILKKKEIEEYEKIAKKQKLILKNTFGITFGIIGLIFLVIGVLDFNFNFGDGFIIGVVYSIIGGVFLLTGILCYMLINPNKILPYSKYKERMNKYNYTYATTMQVQMLEKRLEILEEKIEELQK